MMWAVAGCGVVFAMFRYVGVGGGVAVVTLVLLVLAHVLGNAFGQRLRDQVSRELNPDYRRVPRASGVVIRSSRARLYERTPLGRLIVVLSGVGAAIGASLGAIVFWSSASTSGWLVGSFSSGVLGAFLGFMLASFAEMSIRAWWQATRRD